MFRVAEEQRFEKPSIAFLDRVNQVILISRCGIIPILCNVMYRAWPFVFMRHQRFRQIAINRHAPSEKNLNFLRSYELSHDPPYSVFSSAGKIRIGLNDRPSFVQRKCIMRRFSFLVRSFLSEIVTRNWSWNCWNYRTECFTSILISRSSQRCK